MTKSEISIVGVVEGEEPPPVRKKRSANKFVELLSVSRDNGGLWIKSTVDGVTEDTVRHTAYRIRECMINGQTEDEIWDARSEGMELWVRFEGVEIYHDNDGDEVPEGGAVVDYIQSTEAPEGAAL